MKIEKKVWPKFFRQIEKGNKNFELRLGDWKCKPGDILILQEWNPKTKKYTGKTLTKKVTFVFRTKTQKFWGKQEVEKYGFQVISFK